MSTHTPSEPEPEPNLSAMTRAANELFALHAQIDQARAVLAQVHQDVASAQDRLASTQAGHLAQANEQLLQAVLQWRSEAQTCHDALQEFHRLALLQAPLDNDAQALNAHSQRLTQLREANAQLVLAALSAQELQAAAEQARRKQTEFMGVLAHELRHPLAPIRNAAAILGKIPTNEPMLSQLQAIIDRQVAHMSRLVSDLLDISRVDTGKLRLVRKIVNMTHAIDEAVCACRPAMDTRLQKFSVQLPPCPIEVNGDPTRLAQVLSNLLDNASKYTPVGGSIALGVVVEGQALVIEVSDSGIGITPEALPHVFDPFVQELHATAFNSFGLGIGLTVVRELVESHGGSVVASSGGTGLGSQFVVTLPLFIPLDAGIHQEQSDT